MSKNNYYNMPHLYLKDSTLHYLVSGSGIPVVLVHGMGSDHTVWGWVEPLLKKHYRVVSFDLRGHGRSSKSAGPYSMELFSKDINQLLESLNITKAHFVGHSMGGAVLMELGLKHPEKFSSLTLISSFAYVDSHLNSIFGELLGILNKEGYNSFFDRCLNLVYTPRFIQENKDLFLEIKDIMADYTSIPALKATIHSCLRVNFINSLENVNVPTLVIAGREDVFTPLYHANKIRNTIPSSKMEVMDDVGHNLMVENPHDTHDLINNFFKDL